MDVKQITALHRTTVELWHRQSPANTYQDFLHVVCEQHKFNFLLWHEEDLARSPTATDREIAGVKRRIDGYNQKRNDWIERLDDYLKRELEERGVTPAPGARHNSETPGAAIDRLSVLSLRLYHMAEQLERSDATAEHVERVKARLSILETQHEDLTSALGELLADLYAGRKRLKIYRQYKMYNDPTLNPVIYAAPQRKAG